jgi:hypothetical protein
VGRKPSKDMVEKAALKVEQIVARPSGALYFVSKVLANIAYSNEMG